MNKLFKRIAVVFSCFSLLFITGCVRDIFNEPNGAHTVKYDKKAPKTIESEELASFSLTVKDGIDGVLDNGCYSFSAKLENGAVKGEYGFHPFNGDLKLNDFEFQTSADFMGRVDEIIRKYNLVSRNGEYDRTAGIPDEFGYDLSAEYASGEYISCGCNSANYVPDGAFTEFHDLFFKESGAEEYYDTDRMQNVYYSVYQRDVYTFDAWIYEKPDGEIVCSTYEHDHVSGAKASAERAVPRELLDDVYRVYKENGLDETTDYPRRETDVYISLFMLSGRNEEHIYNNTNITDEQNDALMSIKNIISDYTEQ